MSPRAKKPTPPKHGGARPGAGRPRTLEPPEDAPRIVVRLDAESGLALLRYAAHVKLNGTGNGEASASVRELLTAWGEDAEVRNAVESWRAKRWERSTGEEGGQHASPRT